MCIIFPLTQGAKLLGSGPGPCWRGSEAAVVVLVHHPAVSERPGGRRDPSVEAHTRFDSSNASTQQDGSQGSIAQPGLFLSSLGGRGAGGCAQFAP